MPSRALALAGFAALAAVAWAGTLGPASYFGLGAAACAAAALVVARAPGWAYLPVFAAWVLAVPLLAGLGAPSHWPGLVLQGTESIGSGASSPTGAELAGALTAVLWLSGACWIAGALAVGRVHRAVVLACAAGPWLLAVGFRYGDDAVWEGGVVVALAAWWFLDRRDVLARRVVWVAAAAGVALGLVAAPGGGWFDAAAGGRQQPSVRTFDPDQTYGPLRGPRDGEVLMRVRSRRDSYWRMRALDLVDERGWRTGVLPITPLPEPKARIREATVEIRALRGSWAVGPGRIESIPTGGRYVPFAGGAFRLRPTPGRGDAYRVRAASVDASPAQLASAPSPTDPRARGYLTVGGPGDASIAPALFGAPRDATADAQLRSRGYGRTLALARRLAAGATSEADVVRRVRAFLATYRYSTNAPDRARPLEAFLFEDRRGSCQHFAGAAALLLRLAGVPARVAVGFARGTRDSQGRWVVRDRDAHAWVEVWYQGLGWVTFDPTPPNIESATLASASTSAPLVGIGLMAVWGLVALRPRRGGTGDELLLWLARRSENTATLREAAAVLERTVGPRTATLALVAEHGRYAKASAPPPSRRAVARAVWTDRGPVGAIAMFAAQRKPRNCGPPHTTRGVSQ